MGAVFGAGAVDRTARPRARRPSGRERSEALARPMVRHAKTQMKKHFFSTGRGDFSLGQRKVGAANPRRFRGGIYAVDSPHFRAETAQKAPAQWAGAFRQHTNYAFLPCRRLMTTRVASISTTAMGRAMKALGMKPAIT